MMRVSPLAALALALLAVPQVAVATRPERSAGDLMLERINTVRAAHDLRPLRASPRLERAASRQAGRLAKRGAFGHGYLRMSGFSSVGEALGYHRGPRLAVRWTVRRWLRSAVHRSLVLGESFGWAGAGHASRRISGRRTTLWVLRVGRR